MTAARDGGVVHQAQRHDRYTPSDRTNKPFRISVLPWRSGRGRSISDAHGANTPKEQEKKKPKADKNQPKTHVSAYKAAQDQAKPSFNPFAKKT
jgi:hypothetical protein